MISQLVEKLKKYAEQYDLPPFGREIMGTKELLLQAANTIEALSAKLAADYDGVWIVEGNMERLTERTGNGKAIPRMDLKSNGHQKCMERLAEYEDLEEQGKLPRLPCAIGDTVYEIFYDVIVERIVNGFSPPIATASASEIYASK